MPGGPGVVMRGPPPTSGIHGPPGMVIHQRPDWNMGPGIMTSNVKTLNLGRLISSVLLSESKSEVRVIVGDVSFCNVVDYLRFICQRDLRTYTLKWN